MESIVKSVNPDNGFSFGVVTRREPSAAVDQAESRGRTTRQRFRGLAGDVGSDELDDGVAVAFTFGRPDAGNAFEFVKRGGCDVG
jgi:hypothetical protein